jgi:hypothetical protein
MFVLNNQYKKLFRLIIILGDEKLKKKYFRCNPRHNGFSPNILFFLDFRCKMLTLSAKRTLGAKLDITKNILIRFFHHIINKRNI